MHKLMDYICDELEQLERKAENGKLSMAEIEYADKLTHMKKNLLKIDEMTGEDEYSNDYSMARGRGRNAKRDSMGRYSSRMYMDAPRKGGVYMGSYDSKDAKEELKNDLRELEMDTTDEESKRMIRKWMSQLE